PPPQFIPKRLVIAVTRYLYLRKAYGRPANRHSMLDTQGNYVLTVHDEGCTHGRLVKNDSVHLIRRIDERAVGEGMRPNWRDDKSLEFLSENGPACGQIVGG